MYRRSISRNQPPMRFHLVNVGPPQKGPNRTLGSLLETVDLAQPAGQWVPTGENLGGHQLQVADSKRPQSRTHSADRTAPVTWRESRPFGMTISRQISHSDRVPTSRRPATYWRVVRYRWTDTTRIIGRSFSSSKSEAASEIDHPLAVEIRKKRSDGRPFSRAIQPLDGPRQSAVAFVEVRLVIDVLGHALHPVKFP